LSGGTALDAPPRVEKKEKQTSREKRVGFKN